MNSTLITETHCDAPDEIVYIKSPVKSEILRVNPSLQPKTGAGLVLKQLAQDIFLPYGFPHSTSPDYINYQIWDTVQACCSTVSYTLATRAVLQGIGVGDSDANVLSAAFAWILKDGIGMVARIMFAWAIGSGLDAECKKWRLFADVVNDFAICIEMVLLPYLSRYALYVLCVSSSLKAIVGVAGGATRAAITQHQAIKQNMADVSAKDGSQETCVNLLATVLGLVILSTVHTSFLIYVFLFMTVMHLFANYKAVKALNFTLFNLERLAIVVEEFLRTDQLLTPQEANSKESVFIIGGLTDVKLTGYKIKFGKSLEELTKKNGINPLLLQFLVHTYKGRHYMVLLSEKNQTIYVALHVDHSSADVIEAFFHATLIGVGASIFHNSDKVFWNVTNKEKNSNSIISKLIGIMSKTDAVDESTNYLDFSILMSLDQLANSYSKEFISYLTKSGWDTSRHLLHIGKWRSSWWQSDSETLHTSKKFI